ncbi:MAG: phosphopantetheine-binding protein [Chloroflexota bacterium]|nr:phosphopantetheine-binding protein [Chloroflexota bacterium]
MTSVLDDSEPISEAMVEQKVREAVARALDLEVEDVQLSSSLIGDLGAQSLDLLDIAFTLEREFKIQFPHTDILERASKRFGDDALVKDGLVTSFGLDLIRKAMPELESRQMQPKMRAIDVARLITVGSFARIVVRLLEANRDFPRECPDCGTTMNEAANAPELVCPNCGKIVILPSGDDVLFQDLVALTEES